MTYKSRAQGYKTSPFSTESLNQGWTGRKVFDATHNPQVASELKNYMVGYPAIIDTLQPTRSKSTAFLSTEPTKCVVSARDDDPYIIRDAFDDFLSRIHLVESATLQPPSSTSPLDPTFIQGAFSILNSAQKFRLRHITIPPTPRFSEDNTGIVSIATVASGGVYEHLENQKVWGYHSRGFRNDAMTTAPTGYVVLWGDADQTEVACELTTNGHCEPLVYVAVEIAYSRSWEQSGQEDDWEEKVGCVYTRLPLLSHTGNVYQYRYFNRQEIRQLIQDVGLTLRYEGERVPPNGVEYNEDVQLWLNAQYAAVTMYFDDHTKWST